MACHVRWSSCKRSQGDRHLSPSPYAALVSSGPTVVELTYAAYMQAETYMSSTASTQTLALRAKGGDDIRRSHFYDSILCI